MYSDLRPRRASNTTAFGVLTRVIAIVFMLVLLVDVTNGNSMKRGPCREPSRSDLLAKLRQYNGNALSFAASESSVGEYQKPASTACPLSYDEGAPLEHRSTCPYYYVENTDEDRFPATLIEARCYRCHTCISDLRYRRNHHPSWRCEEVMTPALWVLRNSHECNVDGEYIYVADKVHIQTACTCGRSRF